MKRVAILLYLLLGAVLLAETPAVSKDLLIKSEVETAVSMLAAVERKHQKGEMSLKAAKQLGAELLRELRYGDEGYFWADTEEGVNVVLYGKKEVEGKNRFDVQDVNGVYFVREFLRQGKKGGGYVEYHFPKLGEEKQVAKRSYVMSFKPFGWVVGSGYYRQ
jgi:methyl-accepting chemotaxis protein